MLNTHNKTIAIIGGGPAGLMAAEVIASQGFSVNVFDAMPTMARKFLRAGIGGLNITFDEPLDSFLNNYYDRRTNIEPLLRNFTPTDLIAWVHGLGIQTFIGSSHRVFPVEKKASPLLRAWIHRLRQLNVVFHNRYHWLGWNADNALRFATTTGEVIIKADATLLAMGGGSWPQLGSNGDWVALLREKGIAINPLRSANCGFSVNWSDFFSERFAGHPIKSVTATIADCNGSIFKKQGELVVTKTGIEGGLIYALSSKARDEIERSGTAIIYIDLSPQRSQQQITERLMQPQGKNSRAKHLKNKIGIDGVKAALLREYSDHSVFSQPQALAKLIKAFPITLIQANPLADAISTSGGVCFDELDSLQMIKKVEGVFCAGEMLDWEAPTGGYLLSACFASGYSAGQGILQWIKK